MPQSHISYGEFAASLRWIFGQNRAVTVRSGDGRAAAANIFHDIAYAAGIITRSYNFCGHRTAFQARGRGFWRRQETVRSPHGACTGTVPFLRPPADFYPVQ